METLPLYNFHLFFHPNLSLVDYVNHLLDAYPIRTFLEALDVTVRLNIPILVSFPHKCG